MGHGGTDMPWGGLDMWPLENQIYRDGARSGRNSVLAG